MTTAAEIIAEEQEEQDQTIEEEFRELHEHAEKLMQRLERVAGDLSKNGREPATKEDLATLYRFVSGDVVSALKDLIGACGAAFNDAFEAIESDSDNELGDDSVQIYTILLSNIEAFTNLKQLPGITSEQKEAFDKMITLNQGGIDLFNEQYGDEIAERAREYVHNATAGETSDAAEN